MIASIDVGIKNLAICVADASGTIILWDVIDMGSDKKKPAERFVEIAININAKLTAFLSDTPIEKVIIENQISPIANKMKTIQGMLVQFFVMWGVHHIEYISAVNKLKPFNLGKLTYAQRKRKSVEIARETIAGSDVNAKWLEKYDKCKKKDDLADCLLQLNWYLFG